MTTRLACRMAVLTAGLMLAAGAATADDTKKPEAPKSIKEIMKKGHAGKKSLLSMIGNELKTEKWEEVKKATDVLKVYGETIGGFDPPMGDKESWKKMTDKYKDDTAAMSKAADKKDAAGTEKSLKSVQNSCKGCHSAHKPN